MWPDVQDLICLNLHLLQYALLKFLIKFSTNKYISVRYSFELYEPLDEYLFIRTFEHQNNSLPPARSLFSYCQQLLVHLNNLGEHLLLVLVEELEGVPEPFVYLRERVRLGCVVCCQPVQSEARHVEVFL